MRVTARLCLTLLVFTMAACAGSSGASTPPTATPGPPTFAVPTPSLAPQTPTPDDSAQIWLEQPFGESDSLAVLFYTAPDGSACVRFSVSLPEAQPVSGCRSSGQVAVAVVAVQGVRRTAQGETFTIVVGRVVDDKVRVVAFEMESGAPLAPEVDGGGVIAIVPGANRALQAVPIDEFGNTVGQIFKFR